MKYIVVLYLVIPVYMVLLAFIAQGEKLPEDTKNKEGIEKIFLRLSAYIYRRFLIGNRLFMKSPSRRCVRENLIKLDSEADINSRLSSYYIKKISTMLILIFMGSLLALLSHYSVGRDYSLHENGEIVRNEYGEGEKQTRLTAIGAEGEKLGDFDIKISELEYTKEETDKLYKDLIQRLPEIMLQENEDLKHVSSDLNLPKSLDGLPFEITWQTDDMDILHSDGKVDNNSISFTGEKVLLTAEIKYKEYKWEHIFDIDVIPRDFSDEEILYQEIEENLKKNEETTRYKDRFIVPDNVDGTMVFWKENIQDSSLVVLMLSVVAAISIFVLGDNDLTKQVEERRKQMILEYPAFVSRLVLYMGSGMSVRAILMKFSREYKKSISEGGKRSFLYDEISKSCHELESGVPEISVYERLGIRCGSQQYARLVTLLSQNLKKGNSEMMMLLREESDKATMERMSYARKLGEEAGTKLLIPMIMMLFIVMVVIMVPAYLSF